MIKTIMLILIITTPVIAQMDQIPLGGSSGGGSSVGVVNEISQGGPSKSCKPGTKYCKKKNKKGSCVEWAICK